MAATPPTPAPPRILLAGDAHDRLHQLFKRVKSVMTPTPSSHLSSLPPPSCCRRSVTRCATRPQVNQSTGSFHALLCVGQFFSPEGDAEGAPGDVADYLEGHTVVPRLSSLSFQNPPNFIFQKLCCCTRACAISGTAVPVRFNFACFTRFRH
jgi:hypothetical protein